MKELYKILEIKSKSISAEIKKAYRSKSKIHHPDKGGDPKEFNLISKAYQILIDDDKRERYDKGESAESILSPKKDESFGIILNIFYAVIEKDDPESSDIVKSVRDTVQGLIQEMELEIKGQDKLKNKHEICASKIKHKNKNNFIIKAINIKISKILKNIEKLKEDKADYEKAFKIMQEYDYDFVEDAMIDDGFGAPFTFLTSTPTST